MPTAAPLRWGNEPAPGCPVPRVPAWATRTITGWRLDRDRLAAVLAAVAPGVPILDASTRGSTGSGRHLARRRCRRHRTVTGS